MRALLVTLVLLAAAPVAAESYSGRLVAGTPGPWSTCNASEACLSDCAGTGTCAVLAAAGFDGVSGAVHDLAPTVSAGTPFTLVVEGAYVGGTGVCFWSDRDAYDGRATHCRGRTSGAPLVGTVPIDAGVARVSLTPSTPARYTLTFDR